MNLPKALEPLAEKRVWVCHPMIWNPDKHNGVGGYDKPPINPRTLGNAYTNNPDTLGTFPEAVSQIGKTARVRAKGQAGFTSCEVVGVGIALVGTGLFGLDYDNVADAAQMKMTSEAFRIMETLGSYTEFSPSGLGLHTLCLGTLPEGVKRVSGRHPDIFGTRKGEYQMFNSGYMTITGRQVGKYDLKDGTKALRSLCEEFFKEVPKIPQRTARAKPKRHEAPEDEDIYSRWLREADSLNDDELLQRIYQSGSTGAKVERLFSGDISDYDNDHSRADQALCSYLYGFTQDRDRTERLFRSSALYRSSGKSRNYIGLTLDKAEKDSLSLYGHIEFTAEERREYARRKQQEEEEAEAQKRGYASAAEWNRAIVEMMRNRRKFLSVVSESGHDNH